MLVGLHSSSRGEAWSDPHAYAGWHGSATRSVATIWLAAWPAEPGPVKRPGRARCGCRVKRDPALQRTLLAPDRRAIVLLARCVAGRRRHAGAGTRRGGHPELARGLRVKLARLLQSIALLEFLERSGSLWTKLSVHRSGIVAIILESLLCLPQFFRTRGWVRGRC